MQLLRLKVPNQGLIRKFLCLQWMNFGILMAAAEYNYEGVEIASLFMLECSKEHQ